VVKETNIRVKVKEKETNVRIKIKVKRTRNKYYLLKS
jgi:hypothetical protein